MTKTRLAACFAIGIGCLAGFGSRALAGDTVSIPVFISSSTGAGFAYGALGSARNGPGSVADIGCSFTYTGQGVWPLATCSATDTTGLTRSCVVPPGSLQLFVLRSMSDDTLLYFSWDASGDCTEVQTANGSAYEPKLL